MPLLISYDSTTVVRYFFCIKNNLKFFYKIVAELIMFCILHSISNNASPTIMNFSNEFPKSEVTVVTDKKVGSLIADNNCTIHFRDYKGYLDTIQHITLTGNRNAWFGIKVDFKYDVMMGNVKDTYIDEFGRILKVKILS